MVWLKIVFTVALFSNVSAKSFDETIFETEYGRMQGKIVGESIVFLGVPFAKPPIDELRFKDPEPLEKSKEVLIETTTIKPDCMQSSREISGETLQADEDCLYLNIFKPSTPATEGPLPVLVFFPGGNFMTGGCSSNMYDATILAPDINAIVVCANYRLGAFGFLYYEDKRRGQEGDILGNFGIKDQTAALKFIRENIENLGGDPEKITISGQSAGAQSVAVHLTSEENNDLFQQAILMSEPFSVSLKSEDEAILLSKLFFKELGCEESDLSCLHERSAEDILKASDNCSLRKYYHVEGIIIIIEMLHDLTSVFNDKATHMAQPWGPTVTIQPITQFQSVEKPVMIGSLSDDAKSFTPSSVGVHILNFALPKSGKTVIDEYSKWYENEDIFVHFLTDYIFTCPERLVALDINSPDVYRYYFDHVLSFAEHIPLFQGCDGYACHGEDLPFFFQSACAMDLEFTKEEKELVELYSAFLKNFIHHGDPNGILDDVQPELVKLNQVLWKPFAPYDKQTMVFSTNETVECKIGIRQEQCDFLDGIGYYDVPIMN